MFPPQILYIRRDHYEQKVIVFTECNLRFINYPKQYRSVSVASIQFKNTFIFNEFSRQFLHCGAVWTLKFVERDTSYTKAASYMQFCQVSSKLQERRAVIRSENTPTGERS